MSDYSLRGRVPIAGMYGEDGPIVELGVIDVVPEGTIILSDEPKVSEEYTRQARTGLTPDEAREVASKLNEMADRVDDDPDE